MVRVRTGRRQEVWGTWLRRLAKSLLQRLGMPAVELSLLIVGDRRMRQLNRRWRGRRRTTDVLAFPQREAEPLLGDVVICLPQARRQARALGHPLELELTVLLVHGVLHLLGYEHEGVSRQRAGRLWGKQRRLVNQLGGQWRGGP